MLKAKLRLLATHILIVAFVGYGLFLAASTNAAGVTALSDTVTRQMITTAADHSIVFTLDAATTIIENETITVTMASGDGAGEFFDSATNTVAFGDMDLEFSGSADATLAAAATGANWGVAVTNGAASTDLAIVFTAPSTPATYVAGGETITIQIGTNAAGGANQIINPTAPSSTAAGGNLGTTEATRYSVNIGGTFGDSGTFVLPILSDDQVHVTATVSPELTFELHDALDDNGSSFFADHANIVDFGVLSSASAKYAIEGAGSNGAAVSTTPAHGFKVGTNAASGYAVTVTGATLTSPASDTITAIGAGASASVAGTEQFGLCISDDVTGTAPTDRTDAAQQGTIVAAYDCGGTGFAFAAGAANTIANGNAAGPTSATFYDVTYLANINALTESGTYTTDLTYIVTATF